MKFYIKNILFTCLFLNQMLLLPTDTEKNTDRYDQHKSTRELRYLIELAGKVSSIDNRATRKSIAEYVMNEKEEPRYLKNLPIFAKTNTTLQRLRKIREEIDQLPPNVYNEIVSKSKGQCYDWLEDEFPSYEQLLECIQKGKKKTEETLNEKINNTIKYIKIAYPETKNYSLSETEKSMVEDIVASYNTEINNSKDSLKSKSRHAQHCLDLETRTDFSKQIIAAMILKCFQGLL